MVTRLRTLDEGNVLAIRFYTTAGFASLNNPLRDMERTEPHPFPVTMLKLSDGIKKLRTIEADLPHAFKEIDLFRGLRDVEVAEDFMEKGGVEMAAMSTTTDMGVAIRYSASKSSLIFKV